MAGHGGTFEGHLRGCATLEISKNADGATFIDDWPSEAARRRKGEKGTEKQTMNYFNKRQAKEVRKYPHFYHSFMSIIKTATWLPIPGRRYPILRGPTIFEGWKENQTKMELNCLWLS